MVPDGVTLKTLSIVLQKIDTVGSSGVSISTAKKNKRKLLPLEQRPPSSLSLENFNLAGRFKLDIIVCIEHIRLKN